ncbi:hypothetical protein J6590_052061 [Homalodisca vitripennis]|nr:hypothetical protein J6590_052061 [Homalodisca vitripennis]
MHCRPLTCNDGLQCAPRDAGDPVKLRNSETAAGEEGERRGQSFSRVEAFRPYSALVSPGKDIQPGPSYPTTHYGQSVVRLARPLGSCGRGLEEEREVQPLRLLPKLRWMDSECALYSVKTE